MLACQSWWGQWRETLLCDFPHHHRRTRRSLRSYRSPLPQSWTKFHLSLLAQHRSNSLTWAGRSRLHSRSVCPRFWFYQFLIFFPSYYKPVNKDFILCKMNFSIFWSECWPLTWDLLSKHFSCLGQFPPSAERRGLEFPDRDLSADRTDWVYTGSPAGREKYLQSRTGGGGGATSLETYPGSHSSSITSLSLVETREPHSVEILATPAFLCHKEPAQVTQSLLLGAFLAFRWFFMA